MIDWLSQHAGMVGLLFFFSVFVGIGIWLFLPGGRGKHEPHKYIPLEDNDDANTTR